MLGRAQWEQWKEELDKVVIDDNTILVGLSAGGYALARYLDETKKRVKKLILVAPSGQAGDRPEASDSESLLPNEDEFYSYKITPELQSQITDGVDILVSNDSESILKSVEMYKEVLGAKEIKLEGLGHFSFLIKELPELLNEISIADSKPELRETRRGFESQF